MPAEFPDGIEVPARRAAVRLPRGQDLPRDLGGLHAPGVHGARRGAAESRDARRSAAADCGSRTASCARATARSTRATARTSRARRPSRSPGIRLSRLAGRRPAGRGSGAIEVGRDFRLTAWGEAMRLPLRCPRSRARRAGRPLAIRCGASGRSRIARPATPLSRTSCCTGSRPRSARRRWPGAIRSGWAPSPRRSSSC